MGNVHVANGSKKAIRARVSQEKVHIKEISLGGSVGGPSPFSLSANTKADLDHSLDEKGFARIGPGESLEFDVEATAGEEFVTITTADDEPPTVICYNYNPPGGRSVIVTDNLTIQLSIRHGDMWKTDDGRLYGGPNKISPTTVGAGEPGGNNNTKCKCEKESSCCVLS